MPAYRPPQRRREGVISDELPGSQAVDEPTAPASSTPATARTLEDLVNSTPAPPSAPGHIHLNDIKRHFWPGSRNEHSTLNGGADEKRDELTFILVFPPGHPKWQDENVLYCKSELELLPGFVERRTKSAEVNSNDQAATGGDGTSSDVEQIERKMKQVTTDEVVADDAAEHGAAEEEEAHVPEGHTSSEETGSFYTARGSFSNASSAGERALLARMAPPHMLGLSLTIPEDQFDDSTAENSESMMLQDISPSEYEPSAHSPIAVFETVRREHNSFHFVGWYTISHISILAPYSKQLAEMMESKWSGTTTRSRENARPATSWAQDLARKWAAVKLARLDPEDEKCPPELSIEIRPREMRTYEGRGGQRRSWQGSGGRGWGQRDDRGRANTRG
jgi:hypothetical protein